MTFDNQQSYTHHSQKMAGYFFPFSLNYIIYESV